MIFSLRPRESVRNIMKDLNILSANQMFHLEVSKQMQNLALKDAPEAFSSIFQHEFRFYPINLRSASSYIPAVSSTEKAKQCIRFSGPKIWNNLPIHIRKEETVPTDEVRNSDQAPYFSKKRFVFNMKLHALTEIDFVVEDLNNSG